MAYVTVDEVRAEGVAASTYPKEKVEERIVLAQNYIESMTGRFFEKRDGLKIEMDGTGSMLLYLPVPPVSIASITSVTIDDDALETEDYKVVLPDARLGKRLCKLVKVSGKWPIGIANVAMTADFGYVEVDGTPLKMAKELCIRLVVWNLPDIGDLDAQRASAIVEESLKNYRYRLSETASGGAFGDWKIDRLIAQLSPPRMAVA